jgi:hypothetical protein
MTTYTDSLDAAVNAAQDSARVAAGAQPAIAGAIAAQTSAAASAAAASASASDAAAAAATANSASATANTASATVTRLGPVYSKNLYNPADAGVQAGYVLVLNSTGTTAASANYTTTGYIAVTAGQAYTLSNPRNVVLYTTAKAFQSQTDNSAMTALTVTPSVNGYMRASFNTATYGSTFQVEQGSSATSFAAYGVSIPGLDAAATATAAKAAADAAAPKVAPISVSKNLFNYATATPDTLLNTSTGVPGTYVGYSSSDFIPVTAGASYTSTARHVIWFNSSKAYMTFATDKPDNAAQTAATVVAPSGATYARIDFSSTQLASMQFEKSATQTSFAAFGVTIDGLNAGTTGPVTLKRNGTTVSVTSALGASTLATSATLARTTTNGGFNIDTTTLDGALVHSSQPGDEVTPIRTQMGTVGANHGFTCVNTFTNPDGKATADLGSKWTDGTREYVLLAIDATTGKLVLGGSYTTAAGVVSSAFADPTVNLTHVSGATHTGAIDYTTKGTIGAYQLYPSVARMNVSLWADGQEVTADGVTKCRAVEVRESYEVLDYASLYDTAAANVGTPYTSLTIAGAVRVTNTFRYSAGGRCRVSSTLTELKPTTLAACGFLQSVALVKSGATLTRYVPGVAAIGGRNWSTGVDMTSYVANDIVTTGTLLTANVPPAFTLDRLTVSGSTVLGFALGYLPWGARDSDASTSSSRITNAASDLWDLRGTKKSYPTVVSSKAAGWGRLTVEGFRVYLTPAQTDAVIAAGGDGMAAWARLDTAAGLS